MKIWNCLLVASLFSGYFSIPAWAGKESGGGILIAAEFAATGRQAIKILSTGDHTLNLVQILASIKETKIIPVDNICYLDPVLQKDYCEDAHYDSANNVILLAHANWDQFSCKEKIVLSAHEFLRASGMETEDYGFSGRFISGNLTNCSGLSGGQREFECADLSKQIENHIADLCDHLAANVRERKSKPFSL